MDSSLLAAMASAGDESPGGDGTMNGDGLRAPLETGAREQTPRGHRIEPGANDPRTWRDRAISGGGLRARTGPGTTTQPAATGDDRATGDDWSRGSTERSYAFKQAIEVAIWFLEIMLDALQLIQRRTEQDSMLQSPV